jgi:hypothetical protein
MRARHGSIVEEDDEAASDDDDEAWLMRGSVDLGVGNALPVKVVDSSMKTFPPATPPPEVEKIVRSNSIEEDFTDFY